MHTLLLLDPYYWAHYRLKMVMFVPGVSDFKLLIL
jgi:hypothetical protein